MYDEEIPNNSFNLFGTEAREHEGEDGETYETRGVMKESYEGETHDYLVKLVRTEIADLDTGTYAYPYQYTYTHRRFVGKFIGFHIVSITSVYLELYSCLIVLQLILQFHQYTNPYDLLGGALELGSLTLRTAAA